MSSIKTYRNIKRIHQIIRVLIKHGFGEWVAELRVVPIFTFFRRYLFFWSRPSENPAKRARLVLDELGPTFVKLGQIISTRADIFPPDYIEEFKKLQDEVSSLPFSIVKDVVESHLKVPLSESFADFNETPVAAASIAQVHYATLHDGTKVAVKIRRPGIESVIDSDISVMEIMAKLLDRYIPAARRYRPLDVVAEFSRVIHREEDFIIEGANIVKFCEIFKDDSTVIIPRVFWDYTTSEVLTMERVEGVPIDEVEKIRAMGLDLEKIANNGVRAFFKQVFEYGFFHADLHPGNIYVDPDGSIIYLDFGIVGRLDEDLRKYLAEILHSLINRDYRKMAQIHRDMGLISKDIDINEFEDALRAIVEPVLSKKLVHIDISALLMRLINTARRFDMRLQPSLLLLQKSMVIIEGVGRQLYPDIDPWEIAKPLITRWMIREKVSPRKAFDKGKDVIEEMADIAIDVPRQIHGILKQALNEDLKIGFKHYRISELIGVINSLGARLFSGFILSALILSSTALLILGSGWDMWELKVLGGLGYLFSFIITVILAVKIFKRVEF
ncbi:MAG: 2-polyprenylphenol 6-hydroxylase [Thermodesulfobacteriota bacterium]